MTADAHHAHARRWLWLQVCCESPGSALALTWAEARYAVARARADYDARHKPRRTDHARWDWPARVLTGFYAVAVPLAGTCLIGFIKVRSGS